MATHAGSGLWWGMPGPKPKAALRTLDVSFFDVVHAGETHRVHVKRVASARRYTLRVRAATRDVVLTLPPRGSLLRAKLFAERHAAWIGTRLARLPASTPFGPGAMVPLRGVSHQIVHRPGARGTVWTEPADPRATRRRCCASAARRPSWRAACGTT